MGYDMYLVDRDTSKDEECAAARTDMEAAAAERGRHERGTEEYDAAQAKVMSAYGRIDAADINYFRLNVWGMGKALDSMSRLAMLAHEYDQPPWPEPEQFGLTADEWYADDDDEEPANDRIRKMRAAYKEKKSWSPPDEPGIPVHKLCSNDGWIVTPVDLVGALKLYEMADPGVREAIVTEWQGDDGGNHWLAWIDFLKRAEAGSGFRVW